MVQQVTPRSAKVLALGAALLTAGGVLYGRHVSSSRRAARAAATLSASVARGDLVLRVPHAPGGITLDGDTDDPRLAAPAGTGTDRWFPDWRREAARPSPGQARLGGRVPVPGAVRRRRGHRVARRSPDGPNGLDDFFRLVFSQGDVEYAIEVSPMGVITDSVRRGGGGWDLTWNSGAHASREVDGSINNPKDTDEEWAIELAIPFESLGMRGEPGENIGMSVSRCDTTKRAQRVCGGWGKGLDDRVRGRIVLE